MALKFDCGVMKVGNSTVLVLPKSLCENFGIKEKTKLKVLATENGLVIPLEQNESDFIKEELENTFKEVSSKRGKK